MSPLLFQATLYASLLLCALGLAWRASAWFRIRIGPDASDVTPFQRLADMLRGAACVMFTPRVYRILGACFLDVLLQRRLFASEKLRWFGHLLIVAGFTLLVLMHALAVLVTAKLFPGYQPTLDPYVFLRNLFGIMVVAGVMLLLIGRWRSGSGLAPVRRPLGAAFMALLALVLVTGFLLEAHKIASPRAFYRMAEQFAGTSDPVELKPLRALWASEFGVAFDDLKPPMAPDQMEQGGEMHGHACASCHARPTSAFVSYPVARVLAPLTSLLDAVRADVWLWYWHVFACFIGLASLPLTRFFHVVAGPVSLLVNAAVAKREGSFLSCTGEGRATIRALALDACVHCSICDTRCSVAPLARYLGNPYLLPSHKLVATGTLARRRRPRAGAEGEEYSNDGHRNESHRKESRRKESHRKERLQFAEGAFLCTDCARCTSVCPVGLDLEDLWQAGRADLAAAGFPAPAQWAQALPALVWADSLDPVAELHTFAEADASYAPLSSDRRSFSRCVQCQTCTNVCPVVAHSIDPDHGVDLTPQKVMNLLRLGLRDLTLGSRMVWSCATCYQCQENCPEGIRVADIMCELRALAVHRLGAVRSRRQAS